MSTWITIKRFNEPAGNFHFQDFNKNDYDNIETYNK